VHILRGPPPPHFLQKGKTTGPSLFLLLATSTSKTVKLIPFPALVHNVAFPLFSSPPNLDSENTLSFPCLFPLERSTESTPFFRNFFPRNASGSVSIKNRFLFSFPRPDNGSPTQPPRFSPPFSPTFRGKSSRNFFFFHLAQTQWRDLLSSFFSFSPFPWDHSRRFEQHTFFFPYLPRPTQH